MNIEIRSINSDKYLTESMILVKQVFMEYEAPDYEQKGINFFLKYIEPSAMKQRIERREIEIWCSIIENTIVGVVAMRPPCAVSLLFVDTLWHRKGVARQMLEHAIAEYRKDNQPITVHSSPYAVEAYQKMGFIKNGPKEIAFGIKYQPMIYTK